MKLTNRTYCSACALQRQHDMHSSLVQRRQQRTAEVMVSGLNFAAAAEARHTSRQYVPTAMVGMYRSGALTSCLGGKYLCPPLICMQAESNIRAAAHCQHVRVQLLLDAAMRFLTAGMHSPNHVLTNDYCRISMEKNCARSVLVDHLLCNPGVAPPSQERR